MAAPILSDRLPFAGIPFDRTGVSLWRVALVTFLTLFHNELIAALLGLDEVTVRQGGLALLTALSLASLAVLVWRGMVFAHPFLLWPLGLLLLFLVVSLFANTVFFPKPLSHWLAAHYVYLPVLQVYLLVALRCTAKDVMWGIIGAGIIAAVLMIGYEVGQLPMLRAFVRRSIFGQDVARIVIMKYEFFFASLALFVLVLSSRLAVGWKGVAMAVLGVCLALQVQLVQSRQGLIAMGVGVAVALLLDRQTFRFRPFLVRTAMALCAIVVLPILLEPYIALLARDDLMESRELNVAIRFETFFHYLPIFLDTGGVGFGMSAPSGRINNIIAASLAQHVNFTDLGLYGALFQFGVLGGAAAVTMTFLAIRVGIGGARRFGADERWCAAVLAGYFIGWLCVPVPINAFTFTSSIHFGSLVIAIIWHMRAHLRFLDLTRPAAAEAPSHPNGVVPGAAGVG